jgi:hypothetical protein
MRHWRWYSKLLFALLVAAFAYFVWPTPWTYYDNVDAWGVQSTLRTNRFTGRTDKLTERGWQ